MQNREKPRDSMYDDSVLSVRWGSTSGGMRGERTRKREREGGREGRGRKARESNVAVRMRRGLTLAPARRRSKYKETNPVSVGVQREGKGDYRPQGGGFRESLEKSCSREEAR